MNNHDQRIIHSSEDPNWRTPPDCFAALDREFDFTVDGAADAATSLCPYYLGPGSAFAEDALAVDLTTWDPRSHRFFLNPPFSRTLAAAYRTGKIKRNGEWESHPIDTFKAASYAIESWAEWGWKWSKQGFTIVALLSFAPQTDWYRRYVIGHIEPDALWSGHAAREERRLPHRISFLRPDGSAAANAGVNTAVIVWKGNPGIVGPWQPHSFYWSYR